MNKIPMTREGRTRIEKELKRLVSVERSEIIQAITSARELGDLSENAEYHAAKERQSFIEGRIAYLENKLAFAEVIDISKLTGTRVVFGATVVLEDHTVNECVTYKIVGDDEADIKENKISFTSPISRALIGKEPGDDIEVKTPGGLKDYTIINVLYK